MNEFVFFSRKPQMYHFGECIILVSEISRVPECAVCIILVCESLNSHANLDHDETCFNTSQMHSLFCLLLVPGMAYCFPKLSVFDNMWCALRSYVPGASSSFRLHDHGIVFLAVRFESSFVSYLENHLFAFELCLRSCRYRVMMSCCISARFM